MVSQISLYARRGIIALALTAGVSVPAFAAPAALMASPASVPAAAGTQPLLVQSEGGTGRGSYCLRTGDCRGNDGWRVSSRRHWDGDGRHWRRDHHWDRHWRNDRHWHRRHRSHADFGIYLDLSPRPYYVRPAPVYRYRLSDAHIAWCYHRWQSYRAWDNTYQPSRGHRRQCWSPYS